MRQRGEIGPRRISTHPPPHNQQLQQSEKEKKTGQKNKQKKLGKLGRLETKRAESIEFRGKRRSPSASGDETITRPLIGPSSATVSPVAKRRSRYDSSFFFGGGAIQQGRCKVAAPNQVERPRSTLIGRNPITTSSKANQRVAMGAPPPRRPDWCSEFVLT